MKRSAGTGAAPARSGWSTALIAHDTSYHHGSHVHLLDRVDAGQVASARVDAVIVPTARPAGCLREAMRLTRELGCPLMALCSRKSSAAEVADLGRRMAVETIAVDTTSTLARLPRFATDTLLSGTRFATSADVSPKRNLGLLLARSAGWQRIMFLDDDISAGRPGDVNAAAALLDRYDAVGLENTGFPDNSVVCHAYRDMAGPQATFIGVGAMLVAPSNTGSFFPSIYNDDWFFLLGGGPRLRAAVTGTVSQRVYDPYADPGRARSEELGDSLAEGLYWLLDHGVGLEHAAADFWRDFLERRRRFVAEVLDRVRQRQPENRDRMIASLQAAQAMSAFITPKRCVDYVGAWSDDLQRWARFLDGLPGQSGGLDKGLAELGVHHHVHRAGQAGPAGSRVRPAPGQPRPAPGQPRPAPG